MGPPGLTGTEAWGRDPEGPILQDRGLNFTFGGDAGPFGHN